MLNINEESLKTAIVAQVADQLLREDGDLSGLVAKEVKKRIDKIFDERAMAQVEKAIDETVQNCFERDYQRVTAWGQPEGEPTSIRKELERTVSGYWSAKVDPRTGRADGGYNSVTRAEYLMTQICAEDFSKQMKDSAVNITGHLKDGLRNQMGKVMDDILSGLFKVKSLQDQGKVEKPY
ncbi:hypothetical protein [Pseudomonas aeruginosa]|uniref:hypothetical protein n=1 Tax=Pseudomonas aeruginosa TaxID=287 RepID=UPI00106DB74D|nr:hypothetical protein [Pseudomonas aeruginosa]